MWCLGVFQQDLHVQYLPQGKELQALLERHPLSQKKKLFTSASNHTESQETNTTV